MSPTKTAEYMARYREKLKREFPEKYKERKRREHAQSAKRVRSYILLQKTDRACADCGIKYPPYVLDFDHQRDKKFNLGNIKDRSLITIQAEIDKCELVCANCHRERTYGKGGAYN